MRQIFIDWEKGGSCLQPVINESLPDSLQIILVEDPGAPSAGFVIGRPAVPAGSEEAPILTLLSYILGGGGRISRLYQSLVGDYGLATYIGSEIDWSRSNGMFRIDGRSTNEMAGDAVRQVLQVMAELRELRISAGELEEAKNYFKGTIPGYFESTGSTTNTLARLFLFDLTPEYYKKLIDQFDSIEPRHVHAFAERFLNENHMTVVVNGPVDIIRGDLSELGPVEIIGSGTE